ncbi:unnamed protein product [Phytophthora lilii]|uniref:RxLR effector protein n=1 Tax=Phytophthora lilii TaxID=2077276 RepID=A0A9W6YJ26_9STRA|nr:unnamed protein product [Phytophthora lilii]
MRLFHVVVAAIVLVHARAKANPTATDSQLSNSEPAAMTWRLTGETSTVPAHRFLRNGNTENDERTPSTSVLKALPSINKVDDMAFFKEIDDLEAQNLFHTTNLKKMERKGLSSDEA